MSWKKSNIIFITVFILIICCVFGIHIESQNDEEPPGYSVEILNIDSDKYGYKIKQNERVVILQPFVPGVPGKQYFRSSGEALRVGRLVCKRLADGRDFSVTPDDLEQLKIRSFTE